MTQPSELARRHAARYDGACAERIEAARLYLNAKELSLAATECHRALQFQRQAQALTELAGDLERMERQQPTTGLHAALNNLVERYDRPQFPWISTSALRALLAEHQA